MRETKHRPTWSVSLTTGRWRSSIGFTLVELMIVIAIMATLMAIIVPSYQVMASQHRRASCAANMKAIGQALALFREDYQCFPPDATESLWVPSDLNDEEVAGDLIHAAYDEFGLPVETGVHGMGLYTLYYLGVYSAVLPPSASEPRLGDELRAELAARGQGLNGLLWFKGAAYIDELSAFHCPANDAKPYEDDLARRQLLPAVPGVPYLRGWNNYDMYYRRNFWNQGTELLPVRSYDENGRPVYEKRHLLQPYPPADTAVMWCPYHRQSNVPAYPGLASEVLPGDYDLVLFVDGSVRRMTSQPSNRMYEEPPPGAGWPEAPIM